MRTGKSTHNNFYFQKLGYEKIAHNSTPCRVSSPTGKKSCAQIFFLFYFLLMSDLSFGHNLKPSSFDPIQKTVFHHSKNNFENTLILPAIFCDSMILQRGKPLSFWGNSKPGEKVFIHFNNQIKKVVSNHKGDWNIKFPAQKAGGPYQLTVSDEEGNIISLKDILIGDVWLCAGQSNMNFILAADRNGADEIATIHNKNIREYRCPMPHGVDNPENIDHSKWISATGQRASHFSAVAFYFAKKIQERERIPIGIIVMSCGDTRAESWMPEELLSGNYKLKTLNQYWNLHKIDNTIPYNHRPGMFYENVVKPIIPFTIKGVIWYQGESNTLPDNSGRLIAERASEYKALLKTLITDWRAEWKNAHLPFYIVQLPNYQDSSVDLHWATIRQAQLETMKEIPDVGIAVTIDIGNPGNLHPDNKKPVGERLARWALVNLYHVKSEDESGPIIENLKIAGKKIILNFKYLGSGLMSKPKNSLTGFEISESTNPSVFIPVNAVIERNKVIVLPKKIHHPVSIRYAWSDNPKVSLYNKEGLPASPFLIREK
ncbi:MAG: sialate O-acetylesterase [Bacteroidota bacterium]|nr:sialate O-acetylesterase [Bacteroidota bacterium]